ncbi:MAG: GTP cyclohydrolase I FolE2 [Proteobacteria bacterium]|jgi:GTP cyclohydrolase I|nr:GTP cyclohydrolase I FolE2 [Pseudomonadota bacterium]MCG2745570.1 GTP cyclohydrolase FolE2 [Desulfobacteraceae bacterium]MDO8947692.1 GTP cyclohydrolase FolE2 [Desulfocapsaceae bacterium]MBU3982725.1 GTP cyclohydrolase I FolE2 [Pseudomonadota bacterium]MBU4027700.1 GTP cyclohydrolase I FolE2 [Pseudomonadota bacterium]
MAAPINIEAVGIKDIQLPVRIREKNGGLQNTVATVSMQARMPGPYRESCVTVFTTALNKYMDEMSVTIFSNLLEEIREALKAESASIVMSFPYFIEKKAPVTGTRSLMEYNCTFTGSVGSEKEEEDFILSVLVPVTTLCPCSKEISAVGAHNQRAEVSLNVKFSKFIWVEELIDMVEESASCPVYALLKRPDEKYVTEQAYNNPMFVEDVVRKVAVAALAHPDITWFSAGVESFESIHKHSAYAYVDSEDVR